MGVVREKIIIPSSRLAGKTRKDKGAGLRGSLAEMMSKALLCALLLGWGPLYGDAPDLPSK